MSSPPHDTDGGSTRHPGLDSLLRRLIAIIGPSGADSPALSAEVLLAHALGLQREDLLKTLILEPDHCVDRDIASLAESYARRRAGGEPVAYITARKEFYGRPFIVGPAVLVPRPESELLVDLALGHSRASAGHADGGVFADFGTGSGCLAVSLSLELKGWQGIGLDISPAALAVARDNARALQARNLSFLLADFGRPPLRAGSLDLLVSNPPYISEADYATLSPEVRCFEPKSALVPSGALKTAAGLPPSTGLEDARTVIAEAARLLRPGGLLLLEMGCAQGKELLGGLSADFWSDTGLHQDMAGLDRVLRATRNNNV